MTTPIRKATQTTSGGVTAARSCHIAESSLRNRGEPCPAGLVSSRPQRRCSLFPPRLESQQHAGVAERVGFYPAQIEKLRHALVIGTQKLGVDLCGHRRAVDLGESVPAEEVHRESQAEDTVHADRAGPLQERIDDPVTDTEPLAVLAHRDRPDLGEILPDDMQCATTR